MLWTLVTQHPETLITIVARTPLWVGALLAALTVLGLSQLRSRRVSLTRAALMPLALTALSVWSMASTFAGSRSSVAALALWPIVTATVGAIAYGLSPTPAKGTRFDAAARQFYQPASWQPLLLVLAIFGVKYLVGIELALQPALHHDGRFALQISALYGVFNGLVLARALRWWHLVRLERLAASTGRTAQPAAPLVAP